MNMNMNKKAILIVAGVLGVLIILILIAIIMLGNKKEVRVYNGAIGQTNEVSNTENFTDPEEDNTVDNNVDNTTNPGGNTIEGEITTVETEDGGRIPVPPTFSYIGGGSQSGAIIEDEDGNQFVWVPADYNSYARQYFVNNGEGESESNNESSESTLDDLNIKDVGYNEEYDDSILNYGGFYIARYEAGMEETDSGLKAISKANVVPWTQVTRDDARQASQDMYVTNDYFQTDLINSYAWDSTCNWLRNSGINIDDSTDYGNYQNNANGVGKAVETASNDRWQTNNIYDMAGNVWEFTTEEMVDHETAIIGRGGGSINEGNIYPISARAPTYTNTNPEIGFRVVLYLK